MGRINIMYNAASDKVTIVKTSSGDYFSPSMPLVNVQIPQLSKVARVINLVQGGAYFMVDFGAPTRVDFIAFAGVNFSAAHSIYFIMSDNADFTLPVWVSNRIARPLDGGRTVYFTPNPSPVARYLKVELRDNTNPAGYIQMGRFMAGPAWSPAINFSWGAGFQWVDETTFARSVGGQIYADVRPKYRRLTCAFDALSEAEAWGPYPSVYDMMATLGTSGNLFAVYDPDDLNNALGSYMLARRSIYGRIAELAPLTEIMPDAKPHTWALTIEELL
jgi:hypothetical protein